MFRTLVSVAILVAVASVFADDKYTTKYDNIELDEILNNQRLYQKYFDCLRNKGKCTADAAELKELIPDALKTECAKCSEKQKEGVEKVLRFVLTKKPDDYNEIEAIYDPDGTYRKKYEEQKKLAQEGKPIKLGS
ncbi:unnamed protein product [Nesidiocoris tenuis]|uniref:Protein serine threonine kinase n=2 Tax=Nesidiocoris tenuis TaxID=355587 RepID=A0ABN7B7L5_9HEMI|nr:protein serine threonine kinase [Nesidiocoris tenuis]CAB0020117.1 unnamed protein product [Nesidiocoris tenuis]